MVKFEFQEVKWRFGYQSQKNSKMGIKIHAYHLLVKNSLALLTQPSASWVEFQRDKRRDVGTKRYPAKLALAASPDFHRIFGREGSR